MRIVFLLYFYDGIVVIEIADILNCDEETVEYSLKKAINLVEKKTGTGKKEKETTVKKLYYQAIENVIETAAVPVSKLYDLGCVLADTLGYSA